MKWGAKRQAWQKLLDSGRDPPAAFYEIDPPEIWPWLLPEWVAFHELGSERQIGMAVGPIPASKIRNYAAREMADRFDPDSDAADRFFDLIRRMDDAYRDEDKAADKNRPAQVAPDDAAGVLALFKTIENRKKHDKNRAAKRVARKGRVKT